MSNHWDELERLAAEATPGPWCINDDLRPDDDRIGFVGIGTGSERKHDHEGNYAVSASDSFNDAQGLRDVAFIAAARNFLTPERIRRLRAAEDLAEAVNVLGDQWVPSGMRQELANYRAAKEGK